MKELFTIITDCLDVLRRIIPTVILFLFKLIGVMVLLFVLISVAVLPPIRKPFSDSYLLSQYEENFSEFQAVAAQLRLDGVQAYYFQGTFPDYQQNIPDYILNFVDRHDELDIYRIHVGPQEVSFQVGDYVTWFIAGHTKYIVYDENVPTDMLLGQDTDTYMFDNLQKIREEKDHWHVRYRRIGKNWYIKHEIYKW